VTFLEIAQLPLRKLLVFSGRSTRREFWSYALVLWIVGAVVAFALRIAAPDLIIALFPVVLVVDYFAIWAVAVRRLHDTNRSGYMLLIGLIPLAGLILLVWFATASDAGANRYGPNPQP
jgi:uncharacterized membrane protein YhaH (DUF805 family)